MLLQIRHPRHRPDPLSGKHLYDKRSFTVLARQRPKAPSDEGKRSAVAVVNGCPVDSQSRDRARRSELSAEQAD